MNITISNRAIDRLVRKLNYLRFDRGVQVHYIQADMPMVVIRCLLGPHDETGRLAAQVKQALLQGAI
jgi:hypothetical protein